MHIAYTDVKSAFWGIYDCESRLFTQGEVVGGLLRRKDASVTDGVGGCMARKPWELSFLAEAEEVARLRRVVRLHLRLWGLSDIADVAEVCVSELAANVIRHVGEGTPSVLVVEMNGTRLRIAMRDPDTRSLPTLVSAGAEDEAGMLPVARI